MKWNLMSRNWCMCDEEIVLCGCGSINKPGYYDNLHTQMRWNDNKELVYGMRNLCVEEMVLSVSINKPDFYKNLHTQMMLNDVKEFL